MRDTMTERTLLIAWAFMQRYPVIGWTLVAVLWATPYVLIAVLSR